LFSVGEAVADLEGEAQQVQPELVVAVVEVVGRRL
jgi:hypothetical protein